MTALIARRFAIPNIEFQTTMSIITRYILREVAAPSVLALIVISFLAIMGELGERVREIPVEFVTFPDIARFALYFLPSVVSYIIPITFMMGILLAFGRMSQTNEITAMRAAGIPLKRLVMPIIVLGGLLSAATFAIQEKLQPWTMNQAYALIYEELPLRLTLDVLPTGVMHQYADWRVYIGRRDPATGTLYDVDILTPGDNGPGTIYYAESARIRSIDGGTVIDLSNTDIIYPVGNDRVALAKFNGSLPLPQLQPAKIRSNRRRMSAAELFRLQEQVSLIFDIKERGLFTESLHKAIETNQGHLASISEIPQELKEKYSKLQALDNAVIGQYDKSAPRDMQASIATLRWEIAQRFSLPFACLAVCMVAAPLALRSQAATRSYSFALGVGVGFAYYAVMMLCEPRGLHDLAQVLFRSMIPNLVFLCGGCYLVWRVDRS